MLKPTFTAVNERPAQYLAFCLADAHYAVDILRVQEIRGWESVTRVPNQAPDMKGVLNLRGCIIPVFDLRQRFGTPATIYTKHTVVIVLRVLTAGINQQMGIVVDAVSEVLTVLPAELRAVPACGAAALTHYLSGLVSVGTNMIMLLDVDRLLGEEAAAPAPTFDSGL